MIGFGFVLALQFASILFNDGDGYNRMAMTGSDWMPTMAVGIVSILTSATVTMLLYFRRGWRIVGGVLFGCAFLGVAVISFAFP